MRISKLPLSVLCPASLATPDLRIEGDDTERADVGTAVHRGLAEKIRGGKPNLEAIAEDLNVDPGEVSMLFWRSWNEWQGVADLFPDPDVEVEVELEIGELRIKGHADVAAVNGDTACCADFKTGFVDADCEAQVKGYALALARKHNCRRAYTVVIRPRDRASYADIYSRDELESWALRTNDRLNQTDAYNPGAHCGYCPRSMTCPAKNQVIRETSLALSDGAWDVATFGPAALVEVHKKIRLLEVACDDAMTIIRSEVERLGGVISFNGIRLELTETQKKEIIYGPAFPILSEVISKDRLDECFTVRKSEVDDAIKEAAPRGMKGKAINEIMERLEIAGAIQRTTTKRLERKYDRSSKHDENDSPRITAGANGATQTNAVA